MIDIGPNLSNEQFKDDLDIVINNALNSGIKGLILTSTNLQRYHENLNIIEKYKSKIYIKTTYGLHPHNAKNSHQIFEKMDAALQNSDVISIGEFGLDYFRMISTKEIQIDIMTRFLTSAQKYPNKSLFLHEREAFDDFYYLLKNYKSNNNAVVHCFTGDKKAATSYLDLGCYLGITGWVSDKRRNSEIVEAISYIPLNKIMIETDCPYLTPFNIKPRPKRNEPAFLKYIAQSIAEIKNLHIDEVIEVTTQNAVDFFSLTGYNNLYKQTVKVK